MPHAVNIRTVDNSEKQKNMRTRKVSKKVEVVGEKHSTKENSCSSEKEKNLDNEEDTIKKHSEGKKIEKVYKRGEEVEKRFGKEEGLSKDKTKNSDVENIIEHQREVVANEKIEKRVLEVVEDSFCEKEKSFIERSKNDVEVGNDGERKNGNVLKNDIDLNLLSNVVDDNIETKNKECKSVEKMRGKELDGDKGNETLLEIDIDGAKTIEMVSEKNEVELRDVNIQSEGEIELVDSSDDEYEKENGRRRWKEDVSTSKMNTELVDVIHDGANSGECILDSEPVDLTSYGVKLGNTMEQNEKSLTEISNDVKNKEMMENNCSLERGNESANFLQNPSQSSDLSYVGEGVNKTKEKNTVNTVKKSKKRKIRKKRKLNINHLSKLKC